MFDSAIRNVSAGCGIRMHPRPTQHVSSPEQWREKAESLAKLFIENFREVCRYPADAALVSAQDRSCRVNQKGNESCALSFSPLPVGEGGEASGRETAFCRVAASLYSTYKRRHCRPLTFFTCPRHRYRQPGANAQPTRSLVPISSSPLMVIDDTLNNRRDLSPYRCGACALSPRKRLEQMLTLLGLDARTVVFHRNQGAVEFRPAADFNPAVSRSARALTTMFATARLMESGCMRIPEFHRYRRSVSISRS